VEQILDAGIIELMSSKRNKRRIRNTMYHAIGPIWEANHMWLIITIVILFVGFPVIYTTVSTYLHIPLVIMLLGIIARGTAFTFRITMRSLIICKRYTTGYLSIQVLSLLFFLGVIAASAVSGKNRYPCNQLPDAYIFSWLNWFAVAVGSFTISICGFLAAILLLGSDHEIDRMRFVRKAKQMNMRQPSRVVCIYNRLCRSIPLLNWVFGNLVSAAAIGAAVLSLVVLWYYIKHRDNRIIRVMAGFQVTMILLAITFSHYPNIIILKNGEYLSLLQQTVRKNHRKPAMDCIGSIFILPALYTCYIVFITKMPTSLQKNKGNMWQTKDNLITLICQMNATSYDKNQTIFY
jgi:cytochrome d ubiquinol oxidase subunit II